MEVKARGLNRETEGWLFGILSLLLLAKLNRCTFMNFKSRFHGLMARQGAQRLGVALLILLSTVAPVLAEDLYLAPGKPDSIALLGPPPVSGSEEQAADLALSQSVFKARTEAETAHATKSATLSLFNFAPAIGPFFQPGKFPKTEALYAKVKKELRTPIDTPKNHWKRLRPYQIDSALVLGRGEPSASYPSGHSTCGTVQGLILAEIFPEKREAIMEVSRNIGWDRVLTGKHFISDVRAGRVLGQAIVRELLANPAFQRDLAEAKEEAKAVQSQQTQPAEALVGAGK